MLSGRQIRWLQTLADYDYTIESVRGDENGAYTARLAR